MVRPGIRLDVQFGEAGQACTLTISKIPALEIKRKRGENRLGIAKGYDRAIPAATIESILNELVPLAERGEKKADLGRSLKLGDDLQILHFYQNVNIAYDTHAVLKNQEEMPDSYVAVMIIWKNRQCKG
jgi:hypothetical protein